MPSFNTVANNLSGTAKYLGSFFWATHNVGAQDHHKPAPGEKIVSPIPLTELKERASEFRGNPDAWKEYIEKTDAFKFNAEACLNDLCQKLIDERKELEAQRKELCSQQVQDTAIVVPGVTAAVTAGYSFIGACWQLLSSALSSSNEQSDSALNAPVLATFAVAMSAFVARGYVYYSRFQDLNKQIEVVTAELDTLLASVAESHPELHKKFTEAKLAAEQEETSVSEETENALEEHNTEAFEEEGDEKVSKLKVN